MVRTGRPKKKAAAKKLSKWQCYVTDTEKKDLDIFVQENNTTVSQFVYDAVREKRNKKKTDHK